MRRLVASISVLAFAGLLTACRPGAPPAAQGRNPYIAYCANTGNVACINQVIEQYFGPNAGLMECVVQHESGYDRGARNPSGASGLFQLELPLHDDLFAAAGYAPAEAWWTDVYANTAAAWELASSSGFGAWAPDCGL